jgi:YidC/Oxa1 family membrane protein insertase
MDSQKRLLIALGLSLALLMIYTLLFAPRTPPPSPPSPVVEHPKVDAGTAAPAEVARPAPAVSPEQPKLEEAKFPVVQVERNFPLVHYRLSTAGAGLVRAELQGPKMREQLRLGIAEGFERLMGRKVAEPQQMDLARPIPGQPLALSISIQGSQPLRSDVVYRREPTAPAERPVLFKTATGGWEVSKRFEWSGDGYELKYEVTLRNTTSQPVTGELGIHFGRAVDPDAEEKPSFFGGVGNLSSAVCSIGKDVHRLVPNDKPPPEYSGPINFAGIDQQYFLAAVFPRDGARNGRCVLTATATARMATAYFPIQVQPGQVVMQTFGVFIGPKDFDLLAAIGASPPSGGAVAVDVSPHLEKTVDLGIWDFICKILLWILKFFHRIFGNWGVAIIGLTVVVKVALLPLTHKMMVSGEAMKKLQPKMEAIRKKYADDKEKQNLELMKLYQEAKVNPLGGCLPLLIQMPVWFALFTTLRTTYEIYGEPFIRPLWTDLTYKDPTYILPAALGVTMVVTQKLQPQVMDAAQARIMTYVMPIFLTAVMMNYPSGLTLYIFTNNVLSIAQQYLLRKYLDKKGVTSPQEKRK